MARRTVAVATEAPNSTCALASERDLERPGSVVACACRLLHRSVDRRRDGESIWIAENLIGSIQFLESMVCFSDEPGVAVRVVELGSLVVCAHNLLVRAVRWDAENLLEVNRHSRTLRETRLPM